uniref:Uncharacterized protein n=1 Tax=Triticum urartu TaxID=4572 RepID=A0A8R7R3Q6_TRIUA
MDGIFIREKLPSKTKWSKKIVEYIYISGRMYVRANSFPLSPSFLVFPSQKRPSWGPDAGALEAPSEHGSRIALHWAQGIHRRCCRPTPTALASRRNSVSMHESVVLVAQ